MCGERGDGGCTQSGGQDLPGHRPGHHPLPTGATRHQAGNQVGHFCLYRCLDFKLITGMFTFVLSRAGDPDPHGTAFIFSPESGSMREKKTQKKCAEIGTGNDCSFILFVKLSKFGPVLSGFFTVEQFV